MFMSKENLATFDSSSREEAREEAKQLTIFYGGKVVVVDNFPATKVKDLLQTVNGGHDVDKATSNAEPQSLPKPSHNISGNSPLPVLA
jgi:jasmonate ZIM domain-containing protein